MAQDITWSADHCEDGGNDSELRWLDSLEGSRRQRENDPSFVIMLFVGYINTCAVYFACGLALGHVE